jgi:ubiquinone/menaquinone biosynthesis C-methylase UbiE
MPKTQKELAFLRDLYVQDEWTRRFAELVDKHIDLADSDNLVYLNAGTGTHALVLEEKFGTKTDFFCYSEDDDLLNIARDKAAAVSSRVDFSRIRFENDAFDAVLADASFVRPGDLESFVEDAVRVARTGGDVAVFLPAAGSFGEVFSLLWEVLYTDDLGEHGRIAEQMIAEIPTVSRIEAIAANAGLVNVRTQTANEAFEYENGAAFVAAPLVADFLLPHWLEMLSENEQERVIQELAQLIDAEDGTLSFRFSVKATLLTGEKA